MYPLFQLHPICGIWFLIQLSQRLQESTRLLMELPGGHISWCLSQMEMVEVLWPKTLLIKGYRVLCFIWQIKNILVHVNKLLIQFWALVFLFVFCQLQLTVKRGSHILVHPNWSSVLQIFWRIIFHWRYITTEAPPPVKYSGCKCIANYLDLIWQATCLFLAQPTLLIQKQESESTH